VSTRGDAAAERLDEEALSLDRLRYRELLEELRTILPGVQVLFAFLLTAPFSPRFTDMDEFGRDLYGLALLGTAVATVVFLAPASYHRVAPRRLRAARLRTAIRLTVSGLLLLGASVLIAVLAVMRFVFGSGVAGVAVTSLAAVIGTLWYAVPLYRRFTEGDAPPERQ
jgi:hypothetical protein